MLVDVGVSHFFHIMDAASEFKSDSIVEFLDHHKLPLVNILTEKNTAKVYSSPTKRQVFFNTYFHLPIIFV